MRLFETNQKRCQWSHQNFEQRYHRVDHHRCRCQSIRNRITPPHSLRIEKRPIRLCAIKEGFGSSLRNNKKRHHRLNLKEQNVKSQRRDPKNRRRMWKTFHQFLIKLLIQLIWFHFIHSFIPNLLLIKFYFLSRLIWKNIKYQFPHQFDKEISLNWNSGVSAKSRLLYQLQHRQVEQSLKGLLHEHGGFALLGDSGNYLVWGFVYGFVEHLYVIFVLFGVHVLWRVNSHHFNTVYFLRNLKHFVKVLEQCFCLGSITLFNIFFIDLNHSWKSINYKLLQECAMKNRISCWFDINNFQIRDVFEFGNLKQRHNVSLLELEHFQFSSFRTKFYLNFFKMLRMLLSIRNSMNTY